MTKDDDIAGFTLLETLVAFLILSIFLGMAVQTVSQSALNISRSRQQAEVMRCAKAILAEAQVAMRYSIEREGIWKARCRWKLAFAPVPVGTAGTVQSVTLTVTLDDDPRSKTTYVGFVDGAN